MNASESPPGVPDSDIWGRPLLVWIAVILGLAFTGAAVAPEGWRRIATFLLVAAAGFLGPVAVARPKNRLRFPGAVVTVAVLVTAAAVALVPAVPPDPIKAKLTLEVDTGCEVFVLEKSRLDAVPDDLTAEWVYAHGGANDHYNALLTVEGGGQNAVILTGIRIIDFKSAPPIPNAAQLITCPPPGGNVILRELRINLEGRPTATLVNLEFPLKVSNSDPEVFDLSFAGQPCVCSWRLAVDWTSQGRSGTTVLGRDSSTVKTALYADELSTSYAKYPDGWLPPLPK